MAARPCSSPFALCQPLSQTLVRRGTIAESVPYLNNVDQNPMGDYIVVMASQCISIFRPFPSCPALLAVVALMGLCAAQELPKGWQRPPASSTRQSFRLTNPNRFLVVTGDFNGDGVQDKAFLLVNKEATKLGFFVCLTTTKGCDWQRLEEMQIGFLDVMGIAKVTPGKYETACGKGYWECGKEEPKRLTTKRDSIEFFKDESASSVYVYDLKKHEFKSIATSD